MLKTTDFPKLPVEVRAGDAICQLCADKYGIWRSPFGEVKGCTVCAGKTRGVAKSLKGSR